MKKIVLLTVVTACCLLQPAFAATLRVPADYPTIQAAVDASAAGDTVMLADGVYTGSGNCDVMISKSITVASQNGPESTVLDCQAGDNAILLELAGGFCPEVIPGSMDLLETGATYYADRDYTLTGVPSQYQGMQMFKLPDDDRDLTDTSDYISFGAYCDLMVYVAYDSRATALPDWLAGFTYTGDDLYTSLASQDHLKIYSRLYKDGECVNLGANKAPGFAGDEVDNYVLFYSESGSCAAISLEGMKIRNSGLAVHAEGRWFPLSRLDGEKPYRISNCVLSDNGEGIYAFAGDGMIDRCSIADNNYAMFFEWAGARIHDTHISNNAYGIGGLDGYILLNRSIINGNPGYGIDMEESGVGLYNSIVSFNGGYGLMIGSDSIASIINSTVVGNSGGLSYKSTNTIDIVNSIFWQNGAFEIENPDADNSLYILDSNLEGGIAGIAGGGPVDDRGGNIDEDPEFVDPDGPDDIPGTGDDDLHLTADSPCINKGTADLLDNNDFKFDIDQDPRMVGPAPDMGADEYTQNFTFYRDRDRDGYGNPKISIQADTPPKGYVADNTDCNDRKASVHPGARELCNHRDDDCDGQIDENCHCKPRPHHKHNKHYAGKDCAWRHDR